LVARRASRPKQTAKKEGRIVFQDWMMALHHGFNLLMDLINREFRTNLFGYGFKVIALSGVGLIQKAIRKEKYDISRFGLPGFGAEIRLVADTQWRSTFQHKMLAGTPADEYGGMACVAILDAMIFEIDANQSHGRHEAGILRRRAHHMIESIHEHAQKFRIIQSLDGFCSGESIKGSMQSASQEC
jgi:hypothetical protein